MKANLKEIDMHTHSWCSDGGLSPSDLVKECKKAGLEIIALTDHDNADGIPEAITAGRKLNIHVIGPINVEFTSEHQGKTEHILGYKMEEENKRLNSYFLSAKKAKLDYAQKVIKNLQGFDFEISFEEIQSLTHGTIEDFHIWTAAFNNPANFSKLKEWRIKNPHQFNQKFLKAGTTGLKKPKLQTKEIIEIIKRAGGIAIWAHPIRKRDNSRDIKRKAIIFQKMGLDGLEVCHFRHNKEQTLILHGIACKLSMFETIGSDFHTFNKRGENKRMGKVQYYDLQLNLPNLI